MPPAASARSSKSLATICAPSLRMYLGSGSRLASLSPSQLIDAHRNLSRSGIDPPTPSADAVWDSDEIEHPRESPYVAAGIGAKHGSASG